MRDWPEWSKWTIGGALAGLGIYLFKEYGPKETSDPEQEQEQEQGEKPPCCDEQEGKHHGPYDIDGLAMQWRGYKHDKTANLKAVIFAMWMLESDRARSQLAKMHNNFAGMKWRDWMEGYATQITYQAHDGIDQYCRFNSLITNNGFIPGFLHRLEWSPYNGWERYKNDPKAWIRFIGKIWAEDDRYAEKVINLIPQAEEYMKPNGGNNNGGNNPNIPDTKPQMGWMQAKHFTARRDHKITRITLHYTAGGSVTGAVNTFLGSRQASAQYIIGRSASDTYSGYPIMQMVKDEHAAWHSGNRDNNHRSIGIECVANGDQTLTEWQERKLIQLCKYLMKKYGIRKENVSGHRFVGSSTQCPANLFGARTEKAMRDWINRNLS